MAIELSTIGVRFGISCRCFTPLEQSATSRHFSIISRNFPKKRLKPFLFSRSFQSQFVIPYNRCDYILGLAAFGLYALCNQLTNLLLLLVHTWRILIAIVIVGEVVDCSPTQGYSSVTDKDTCKPPLLVQQHQLILERLYRMWVAINSTQFEDLWCVSGRFVKQE